MKVIGLAGESGAGKNTTAGLLATYLGGLGFNAALDSFGAPIKWICRAHGWNGQPSAYWRSEMQALGQQARTQKNWFVRYMNLLPKSVARYDMLRLEEIAENWKVDKFVLWFAYRHGFGRDFTMRQYYQIHFGDGLIHPEFLIIPDVRFPEEADFCQDHGMLLYLEGCHRPLTPDQQSHETEAHLSALHLRANWYFHHHPDLVSVCREVQLFVFTALSEVRATTEREEANGE